MRKERESERKVHTHRETHENIEGKETHREQTGLQHPQTGKEINCDSIKDCLTHEQS